MWYMKRNNELYNGFKPNYVKGLKSDIIENEDNYQVVLDIPGVKKEEVKVNVDDGYLTISVEKITEKEDKKYLRRERYYESASRSFYVGNISNEQIKAKMDNGTLTVTVPKETPNTLNSKYIPIE